MEVVPWVCKSVPKPRLVHCLTSLTSRVQFGVHNSSLLNVGRALHERVFRVMGPDGLECTPQPKPRAIKDSCQWYRDALVHECRRLPVHTIEEVVACYTGQKRSVYELAALSLKTKPLVPSDARIKAFVKAEKINITAKPDPAPRLIQPRAPRFNLELGRYLRINESRILKSIDAVAGERTVCKGYNVLQVGCIIADKWSRYIDPIAVGLDASRWDQHVSVDALKFEHSIYNGIFRCNNLKRLLKMQLRNTGIGLAKDGGVRYTVDGCRMSGDINTSLGNCVLMCGLVLSYLRESGVQGSLLNNGDDCVVIMERRDFGVFSSNLATWFLDRGFKLTIEDPVDTLEQVEFCQSQPVCVNGHWRMVRTPKVSIPKDSYTIVSIQSEEDTQAWCTAVGECGLSLNYGVPVLQGLFEKYVEFGSGRVVSKAFKGKVVEYGNLERLHGMRERRSGIKIASSTRVSFYKAFGVDPTTQEVLEQEIATIPVGFCGRSPVVTSLSCHSALHDLISNEPRCLPKPQL